VTYEINSSDYYIAYNQLSAKAAKKSYFSIGDTFVSGISNRHLRMRSFTYRRLHEPFIAYVSTNTYKGNFGLMVTWLTDFDIAKNEKEIINNVLCKLPHKVLYKTYPEENRRFPDNNPVIGELKGKKNIELFNKTVDMRFFVWKYKIFITSRATSTLGWLVLSGKPVIFINWVNDKPITKGACESFSKGLFLFNSNEKDFYQELCNFLSKPIEEIESLYKKKKNSRERMIKEYFSEYDYGAGKRVSNMITKTVFS
jgi:hypothetical protein